MKAKNKKIVRFLVILAIAMVAIGIIGHFVYKNIISASSTFNLPVWIDPVTANKYDNVWTDWQKQRFYGCLQSGYIEKSTLTSSEEQTYGSDSVVFNGQGAWPNDPAFQNEMHQRKYRLIITPLIARTYTSGASARFRLTLINPSTNSYQLTKTGFFDGFFFTSVYDGYIDGVTPLQAEVESAIEYNNGGSFTLDPGQAVSVETTRALDFVPDGYFTLHFYANDQTLFCIPNPFSASSLSQLQPNVTPTPVPTPRPSVSSTYTPLPEGSLVHTYTYPHGFSTFGNTKTTSHEFFELAGLYLLKYNPPTNSWQYYPGMAAFDAQLFYGYYIYNSSNDEKSLTIPYDLAVVNMYRVVPGWNMLWSVNNKPKSQLQLEIDGKLKTADQWISEGKVNQKIFIIDNDHTTDQCQYFKLLGDTDSSADCANHVYATSKNIPAGKAFWVYVF